MRPDAAVWEGTVEKMMDRNLYMNCAVDFEELQKRYGLDGWTNVNRSIGADGSVWLLFARTVPERIRGMFVDTEANTDYKALCLWVDWRSGNVLGEELYDLGFHQMNFHFIQPIGDDILLTGSRCMRYPDGRTEKNGVIVARDGEKLSELCFGDGIQELIVMEDGRIAAGYFDEGVFGNFGWDQPVGACGLIVWDRDGNRVWENKKYPIYDCYAMNVDEQGALWFYYYDEFQLVKTDFIRDTVYHPGSEGSSAFLINRSHTGLLMNGGYGRYSQFDWYEIKGSTLGAKWPADVIFEDQTLLLKSYRFRGAKAVLLDCEGRMFFREVIG